MLSEHSFASIRQSVGLRDAHTGTLATTGMTNTGTILARTGGLVTEPGNPTNYTAGTLTGGTWEAATIAYGTREFVQT